MEINDLHGASAGHRSDLFEDECLGGGQLQNGEIFGRRANEDEIVVFGVVQGKQAAALDANLLAKSSENAIEGVHRKHFTDSGVMIQDHRAGILGTIVIAHASVGPADESCVAEDDPWLLRSGEKPPPENMKSNGHIRAIACYPGLGALSRQRPVVADG